MKKQQPSQNSKNDSQDTGKRPEATQLDKLKFEVGQEMGLNTKEKNKNS